MDLFEVGETVRLMIPDTRFDQSLVTITGFAKNPHFIMGEVWVRYWDQVKPRDGYDLLLLTKEEKFMLVTYKEIKKVEKPIPFECHLLSKPFPGE